MTIAMPDTTEIVKDGLLTPVGILFLQELVTSQNTTNDNAFSDEQRAFLNSILAASLAASGEVPEISDAYLDDDGSLRTEWITVWGLALQGNASAAQVEEGLAYSMGRIQQIYNRQKLIVDRQNEIVAALVEAGLMENT